MKKLIIVGILSVVATSVGILVAENTVEEKPIEITREGLIKKTFKPQEESELTEFVKKEVTIIDEHGQK